MTSIVFLDPNKIDSEPFTTSKIIAEMTEVGHRRVKDAIRKHESAFLGFGLLGACATESSGGRPEEIVRLNEQQATFLMTLLKNTPTVVAFKVELVRQFYAMRAELMRRQAYRLELKPIRRELTDVIKEVDDGRWSYKKYTDLAYKSAVGKNAAQLRKERNAPPKAVAVDYMTSGEIASVTKREGQIAVLLDMGMDYEQVKGLVLGHRLVGTLMCSPAHQAS